MPLVDDQAQSDPPELIRQSPIGAERLPSPVAQSGS